MSITKQAKEYWEVTPPFLANGAAEEGSLEWSQSISDHRYNLAPYLKAWMTPKAFKNKKVLEIGYGSGSDLIEYARAGADVYGIDITTKSQEITNVRLKAEKLTASLCVYDGKSIPETFTDFDLVYSYGVLHHSPYMDDIITDIYKCLKSNGLMKLMLYNRKSLLYYYSILYQKARNREFDRDTYLSNYSEFREGCPYTRVFSDTEMLDKLWYFNEVQTMVDFLVYDEGSKRKILGGKEPIEFIKTGIVDIDKFLDKYNRDVEDTAYNKKRCLVENYGWHLLVDARK